jgi:hypothetical protein
MLKKRDNAMSGIDKWFRILDRTYMGSDALLLRLVHYTCTWIRVKKSSVVLTPLLLAVRVKKSSVVLTPLLLAAVQIRECDRHTTSTKQALLPSSITSLADQFY